MSKVTWLEDNRIQIEKPKKPKKVTGTRFADLLGLNPWKSEFETWCDITKTYSPPFEDTIYTLAGKTVEPKQAEYMKKSYGMDLISPTDVYGEDPYKKTFGDFFKNVSIFGGMWDYLGVDENGQVDAVLEMKTTKRIEDWREDVPEYYALQAALYAYLLGVDNVIMVASFLEENNYLKPENYQPNINNTITIEFKVSERYPDFEEKIAYIKQWWEEHVIDGISPVYDAKRDKEILKGLRTNVVSVSDDITEVVKEIELITQELEEVEPKQKRLKELQEVLKTKLMSELKEGDTKAELKTDKYTYTVGQTTRESIDKKKMAEDGVLDKYVTKSTNYSMRIKKEKE